MKTYPRSFRLKKEALLALKTLEQLYPDASAAELVSESIVLNANKTLTAPVVRCALLDPRELLHIQACIAALLDEHHKIRRSLLTSKQVSRTSEEAFAKLAMTTQHEIEELMDLRAKIGRLAERTSALTGEDATMAIEQIAPSCVHVLRNLKVDDFLARKNNAILKIVKAVFPEVESDD